MMYHLSEFPSFLRLNNIPCGASLKAQRLKRLPVMQETQVRSMDQHFPLEKETATHSRILAWEASLDRGAWWAIQSMGVANSQT